MKIVKKKFAASFILLAMFLMVSGLCYGDVSMAAMNPSSAEQMDMSHCQGAGNTISKAGPVSSTLMPCCVDRHDTSGTALPGLLNEKTNFSVCGSVADISNSTFFAQRYIFASSSGPPPEPDILFSVIKIE